MRLRYSRRLYALFVAVVALCGKLWHLLSLKPHIPQLLNYDITHLLSHPGLQRVTSEKDNFFFNHIPYKAHQDSAKKIPISGNQPKSPNCSLEVINKHMSDHGWFPGSGDWVKVRKRYRFPYAHYVTPHCRLAPPSDPVTSAYISGPRADPIPLLASDCV